MSLGVYIEILTFQSNMIMTEKHFLFLYIFNTAAHHFIQWLKSVSAKHEISATELVSCTLLK